MKMKCPNSFHGLDCEWRGDLHTLSEHLLKCPKEIITCPHSVMGCEEKIRREELNEHKEKCFVKLLMKMTTTLKEVQKRVEILEKNVQSK